MWEETQQLKLHLAPNEIYEKNVSDVISSKLSSIVGRCFNNSMIIEIKEVVYDQLGINMSSKDCGVTYNVKFLIKIFKCFDGDMAFVKADVVQSKVILLSNSLIAGKCEKSVLNVAISPGDYVIVYLPSIRYTLNEKINANMVLYDPKPVIYKIFLPPVKRTDKFGEYVLAINNLSKQIEENPNSRELFDNIFVSIPGNITLEKVNTLSEFYLHVNSSITYSFYENVPTSELIKKHYDSSSDYLILYPIYNRLKTIQDVLDHFDLYKQSTFVWEMYKNIKEKYTY